MQTTQVTTQAPRQRLLEGVTGYHWLVLIIAAGGWLFGGMFGAATTLVAESMPRRVRSLALGLMQALSAFGNISGSLLSTWIRPGQADFYHGYAGWRFIFLAGAVPVVLAAPILLLLREPEPW